MCHWENEFNIMQFLFLHEWRIEQVFDKDVPYWFSTPSPSLWLNFLFLTFYTRSPVPNLAFHHRSAVWWFKMLCSFHWKFHLLSKCFSVSWHVLKWWFMVLIRYNHTSIRCFRQVFCSWIVYIINKSDQNKDSLIGCCSITCMLCRCHDD